MNPETEAKLERRIMPDETVQSNTHWFYTDSKGVKWSVVDFDTWGCLWNSSWEAMNWPELQDQVRADTVEELLDQIERYHD